MKALYIFTSYEKVVIVYIALICIFLFLIPRDSSFGRATCYGLRVPGIESRYGREFPQLSRLTLGPTKPHTQWVRVLFHEEKVAEAWCWPLTPFNIEVKERVELYLYSPAGHSWPVLGWHFSFHIVVGIGLFLMALLAFVSFWYFHSHLSFSRIYLHMFP